MRQEQLARERLAQLRSRRKAKEEETEDKLVTDGDVGVLQEAVMKALEHKHQDERQVVASKNFLIQMYAQKISWLQRFLNSY